MSETVCAVVVTYNRKKMLVPCLQTLLAQTRPLDHIIVVDNASTDGTREMLARDFPQLFVLPLPENSGGAGGFHAGMKCAYDQGFDWVWVMDDDIETVPSALETMLSYGNIGDLIQARKLEVWGHLIWEAVWDVGACFPVAFAEDVSFKNGKKWASVQCANFEGALIKRKVMDHIGFPDVRYFIAMDDAIYGFLASIHCHAIYINFIGIRKNVPLPKSRSRFHYYFQLRNRFLNYEHLKTAGVPVHRRVFVVLAFWAAGSLLLEVVRNPNERKWVNAKTVFMALGDGLRGRFGRPRWLS